jgi:hypothetical protein
VPAAAVSSSLRARARSLRALLRLFWVAHLVAGLVLAQFGLMLFLVTKPRVYFFTLGFAVSVGVFFASFVLEALTEARIRFLRTLALPDGTTRWLELGLPCGMALVLAAAAAAFGRLPPVTGLVTLGCLWWGIATFRWFSWWLSLPGGGWTEVAWKIASGLLLLAAAALAVVGAWAAHRAGGWPPAAGAAMAMGLLGLRFAPSAHFARGTSPSTRRAGVTPPPPTSSASRAARGGDRAPSWFSTVRRLGLIDVSPWNIAVLAVIYGELAAMGRTQAADMQGSVATLCLYFGLYFGFTLGRAAQQPALLGMLPVSRAQMFVGRVLPWIVLPLVLPAVLLAKGEPPLQILRMVLCVLVILFSMASTLMGPPAGARRLLRALPGVGAFLVGAAAGFGHKVPAQLQSLWVLALLAGGCFAMWARLQRSTR